MINGQKVLGLVPARGGSKGIPRKNIRLLGGKPLIAWTLDEAKKSKYIDRLVCSTDDDEIAGVARQFGADVPFMRPPELATDTARGIDVVLHALRKLPKFDVVVLLQPTSPLRTAEDIDGAIETWAEAKQTVVGVAEVSKSPYWMYGLSDTGTLQQLLPKPANAANRQDLPKAFALNGAVYVASRDELKDQESFLTATTRGYVMAAERSIDLDTKEDWEYAEWKMAKSAGRNQ
jgi:CMP-N,N'-diacetyllegionaminic acid synthase